MAANGDRLNAHADSRLNVFHRPSRAGTDADRIVACAKAPRFASEAEGRLLREVSMRPQTPRRVLASDGEVT
jgi:hypothetical protein